LIPIQSSWYLIASNLPIFSAGVLFVCELPPLVKKSFRAHRLVAVALFMLYLGQNNAW
jgi:hypothetical protein